MNRGVAVWGKQVFVGALDGRLLALDAETGNEIWSVNTIDKTKSYTITGAPRVVKGKVLIGNGGAEFGVRGYVSAYDADLDLLYVGTGNGSPWNHAHRSNGEGDKLFLASIVALDPDDGSYVWHYQTTPGETRDHTATQHMILADLELSGTYYKTGEPFFVLQSPQGAHTWHPMSFNPETGRVDHSGQANGGTLSTAGNLVFQGTGTGRFSAYHAGTGETLWTTGTQTGVLVYKLGARETLPPAPAVVETSIEPPDSLAPPAVIAKGARLYDPFCFSCHGLPHGPEEWGILPNLTNSAMLGSADARTEVALNGAFEQSGMASFRTVMDAEGSEAVRAYLIDAANEKDAEN